MKNQLLEITRGVTNEELKQIIKESIQETILKEKGTEKMTFTIDECVNYTGIGRDKILELAHYSEDFPAFRVGKKFLINKELLDSWLEGISKEKKAI